MTDEVAESAGANASGRRIGVVVVHGVGETELGYSVNTLADSLRDNCGYSLMPNSEVIRLDEPKGNPNEPPQQYRVVRRRATHPAGADVVLEELYWADLSNLSPGRLSTTLGMFRLIFESHHFVDAMLDRSRGFATALLRRLLIVASWLMRGPIAALTISASAVCALLLYGPAPGSVMDIGATGKFVLVQVLLIAAALYVVWLAFRSADAAWYDTTIWLGVIGAAMLAIAAFGGVEFIIDWLSKVRKMPGVEHCKTAWSADCYVNVPYHGIVVGWIVWGGLIVVSLVLAAILILRARQTGQRDAIGPVAASVGVIILQFMLWTIVVVSALFPMLTRGELITELSKPVGLGGSPTVRQAIEGAVNLPPHNQVSQLLTTTPDMLLEWIPRFKFVYALTAVGMIVAILLMLAVYLRRVVLARKFEKRPEERKLPRLVFNPLLFATLVSVITVILVLIFLGRDYDTQLRNWLLSFAAGAAVLFPFLLGQGATNFIHIARDSLDHHYAPGVETAYYFFPKHFRPAQTHPRRWRIQARLVEMLKQRVEDKPYDGIVFVAHSQGSVVVFDYLAESLDPRHLRNKAVGLVTFGSPIGHIYEAYFQEYHRSKGRMERAQTGLRGWTNINRIDDWVGGPIEASPVGPIDNVTLGRGGHTGYWSLPVLAQHVDQMVGKCT